MRSPSGAGVTGPLTPPPCHLLGGAWDRAGRLSAVGACSLGSSTPQCCAQVVPVCRVSVVSLWFRCKCKDWGGFPSFQWPAPPTPRPPLLVLKSPPPRWGEGLCAGTGSGEFSFSSAAGCLGILVFKLCGPGLNSFTFPLDVLY